MNSDPIKTAESDSTGLPGLCTWRGVYLVVTIVFACWVGLLILLSRAFQ